MLKFNFEIIMIFTVTTFGGHTKITGGIKYG